MPVLGDAKLVAGQLVDVLRERLSNGDRSPRAQIRRELQVEKQAQLDEWLPVFTSDDEPIRPYRIMWDLNNLVDRDNTIVTHDSGMPRSQLVFTYQATTPRGYIGWGNSTQLGTGLGLAMGAKLAEPEKLVVNVMGDAAFGMAGMDIESAARLRIPILTIILNNSIMGGHDRAMPVATEKYGSAYLSGDYAAVAADLGAYSEKVSKPGEVIPALKRGIGKTKRKRAGRAGIHHGARAIANGEHPMATHVFEPKTYYNTLGLAPSGAGNRSRRHRVHHYRRRRWRR